MMTNSVLSLHIPVLLNETLEALEVKRGGSYIDCTVGTGGHASAIMERCTPDCRLLGIDADPEAIAIAGERLKPYGGTVILANDNFRRLGEIASQYGFRSVDGMLFDLGLSSLQLDREKRGFSFQREAPLDMRFDPSQEITAADLVNNLSEEELTRLLREYGEEPHARRIARAIIRYRPITTSLHLANIIAHVTGKHERLHPATRTFQALRIAVNQELESLRAALEQAVDLLRPGGRLVVIAYHSLEDRIVKSFFRQEATGCVCPPDAPVCVCGRAPRLRLLTRKVIRPSADEIRINPRSRSAKMRAAERL